MTDVAGGVDDTDRHGGAAIRGDNYIDLHPRVK